MPLKNKIKEYMLFIHKADTKRRHKLPIKKMQQH